MRFIQYLNEEYIGMYKDWAMFSNPTSKEIREHKAVRFIADNRTKKFFISYRLVLHELFVDELRHLNLIGNTDQCFMGMGEVKMSKIEFEDFSYDWGQPPDIEMQKFKWTQKYFTPDSIKRLWKGK